MHSPYPWLASLAFLLLLAGFAVRKSRRNLHVCLMSAGMALDLALVVILAISRDAVGTAMGHDLTLWQQAHVIFSTFAVGLYIPVFALGLARWRGSPSYVARAWHIRLGYWALACRAAGFVFMFSIVGRG
jgi:hypothetical protein